ncbi:TorF family putative porin [Niveispirillum irakense]|uniref:TorF family putative porin n=1 Tax=Niveispirillum irakense TaxID=34011 RepID=UPI000410D199|nr:TorF family putative porin [Niveispirillum irakense]
MRFSRLLASTAIAGLMLAGASAAQAESPFSFSGTAAITSDYVFRGYSQTGEDPAFQAGLTASHESGFFAGVWGSNVDFGTGSDADVEVDLFAGYTNTVNDLTYTVTALYYTYPGASSDLEYDYFEAGLDLVYSIGDVSISGKVYYSPKFFGTAGGDAWYLSPGFSYALTDMITINYAVGFNELENGADYKDWNAGVALKFEPFVVDLKYYDTDVSGVKEADSRFVASLTYAF